MNKRKLGIEKRTATIYARVKPSNKTRMQAIAVKLQVSEAALLDLLIAKANVVELLRLV